VTDSPLSPAGRGVENTQAVDAVLTQVICAWGDEDRTSGQTAAVLLHAGESVLLLQTADPRTPLPPVGTLVRVTGTTYVAIGRLAEDGREGRFLVTPGDRPVRRTARLKVSLPGTVRSLRLREPLQVEIVDLTTGGARVRGVELPVGTQLTLDFAPPGREELVSVRAVVVHGTHHGQQPWIGVQFRLVSMRGGSGR
jgi:hypothetical protein